MQVLKILRLETNLPGHAIHSLRTVCVSVSKPKVNAEIRVTVFVSSRLRHCVTPGHIIDTHNGTSAYTARVKDRSTGKRVISLTFRSLYSRYPLDRKPQNRCGDGGKGNKPCPRREPNPDHLVHSHLL